MEISVVIITYNEEQHLARCLASVQAVADEIIVLDSLSTDRTVEIAQSHGVKVFSHKFLGHIEQKNKALSFASKSYILSLDADEALSQDLCEQILELKTSQTLADGYTMNRRNWYVDRWVRFGGWYPDRKLRLWKSGRAEWTGTNPHDKIQMIQSCTIQHLSGDLHHYAYQTVSQHRKKSELYAEIAAQAKFHNGRKSNAFLPLFALVWKFLQGYFIQFGFLDGKRGFQIALISAREKYLKYQYLRKLR